MGILGKQGLFVRAVERNTVRVEFSIDGRSVFGREGDSVLAAMLTNGDFVRRLEFSGAPRAGFCLMGACQDCWVWMNDRDRARACTTLVAPGMRVCTSPPACWGTDDA